MKTLNGNPDIIIQKFDKGKLSILDKKVYFEMMNKMLCKNKQFLELSIQVKKHEIFLINLEKNIRELFKE